MRKEDERFFNIPKNNSSGDFRIISFQEQVAGSEMSHASKIVQSPVPTTNKQSFKTSLDKDLSIINEVPRETQSALISPYDNDKLRASARTEKVIRYQEP